MLVGVCVLGRGGWVGGRGGGVPDVGWLEVVGLTYMDYVGF